MSWPGTDPYYTYNSPDGNTRRSYYGLNWVPYMCIDGENDENSTTAWQNHILSNAGTTAPLGIELAGSFDYQSGDGSVVVSLTPETGVSGNYTLQVVLVQDNLYYMGSNSYPDHENVMRDMFPSSSGTSIPLEAGVPTTETVDFNVPASLVLDDCRLVVFVQSSSHEVLNSATAYITAIAPLNIPNLTATSSQMTILDDDGDGTLNPGESAEYVVTLNNSCDFVNAWDVVGYLTSTNPYVTVTDEVGNYDFIVTCDVVTNHSDKFAFTISEEAPDISDFEFNLRVVANQNTETPYETNIPLVVSINLFQNHFPLELSMPIMSGNAVVDLDGDGSNEIVVTGTDSLVHVFTLDGTELAGFPYLTGNWIVGAPAVADIDNDGDLEIVATSRDRKIHVIQHDGSGEAIVEAASYLMGTPALDDLDGDGDLEIVAAGYGYDLLVVHHDGTALAGFPLTITGGRMSSAPAIADLDGDGYKDLIVGTWSDSLFAFDLNGDLLDGFPVDLITNAAAPPVVTDLDGDGTLEILIGQDGGKFYAISNTGAVLWMEQLSSASIRTAAAVCDFDGDGQIETVYASLDGFITLLDANGNELAGWPQSLGGACYSSPVIADLDGDDLPEIVVGSNSGELFAFHMDGSLLDLFPLPLSGPVRGTATVADISQDGTMEIVIGTDADLTIVNLKTPSEAGLNWSTARGNNQRTGLYNNPWLMNIEDRPLPTVLKLKQNYPNPFNPSTTIEFGIPTQGHVRLTIYDVLGQEVTELVNTEMSAGNYSFLWNGLDGNARSVETGIYFARINASGSEQIVKMLLLK
jgi:hypothetical protein